MSTFVIASPGPNCSPGSTLPSFEVFVNFLRANPGHWAIYHTYPTKQSGHQRVTRANHKWASYGYKFTSRLTADGVAVYGMFVGPQSH